MVDGHLSAQKAEQIYDAKKSLLGGRDYVSRLEVEQTMDEVMGRPKNAELETRIIEARAKCDEREAEIAHLESAYQDWLRENS